MCSWPERPATAAAVAPPMLSRGSEALGSLVGAVGLVGESARQDGRTGGSDHGSPLSWTVLGVRMGFTSKQSQHIEILAGIERMSWTERPSLHPCLDGSAARAVVNVVCRRPHRGPYRIGAALLCGGRRLIGLEDTAGVGSFVLDLGAEAIHVLTISHGPSPAPTPSSARHWDAVEATR